MRWARFEHDGAATFGIVEDELIEAVEGTPFGEHRRTGVRHAIDDITWLPPVVPPTFYCVGLNYADHIVMEAKLRGVEPVLPAKPDVGDRAPSALIGHRAPIVLPPEATSGWSTKANSHALSDVPRSISRATTRSPAARIHHRERREANGSWQGRTGHCGGRRIPDNVQWPNGTWWTRDRFPTLQRP